MSQPPPPPPDDPSRPGWAAPPPPPPYSPPGSQYGAPPPSPYGGPSPYGSRIEGTAVGSLVCGILAVVFVILCVGLILGVIAVVLGIGASRKIDRSGGALQGRGLAIAGQVLGWIGIGLSAVWIVLLIIGAIADGSDDAETIRVVRLALLR